jgi:CRISPR-associated protein Cas2
MLVIVSYDIQDDRVRTKLAKRLKDFGPRVQYSVFEADISTDELKKLTIVLKNVTLGEQDSIRLYRICKDCSRRIVIWGHGDVTRDKDYYIVK